ncbi:hypothetical protein QCF77_gp15 [Escherichia phage vB_EcoS-Ro145c2YLVW]|uniref:hypothetical protein n=1 Tax=Escherichia phage vB_EcoS-Ro145c2YLVW TaxID=2144178 RepID=UPI0010AFC18D|nr:hypothetical protein QCF77_gp15 [Escherichia phage vB_EcoS-Ro145c2YLVW]AVZ45571.1 hypothetical protein Ro145c2YLVW_00015 [Escherichia phage vB_EcoS-Ro145c2YLVW]
MVLESEKQTLGGQLSINGEFQLEVFKQLLTLTADIENIVALLESGEWGEHCAESELGQRLESEITNMLSGLGWSPDEST